MQAGCPAVYVSKKCLIKQLSQQGVEAFCAVRPLFKLPRSVTMRCTTEPVEQTQQNSAAQHTAAAHLS